MKTFHPSKVNFESLALPLLVGLVVFTALFLGACANGQEAETTAVPQPAVTPSAASANDQAAQPTQAPTATPPAGDSPSGPPAASGNVVEAATTSGPPVQVVTTTNFVGDWARVVGGDRAEVFALLRAGSDPHSFIPGGADVARVADADVVFTVGLGLEANWLHDLVLNASADESTVIELGEVVDPMEFSGFDPHGHGEAGHEEAGHDEHGHEEEPGHEDGAQAEADHEEPGHEDGAQAEADHEEPGHEEMGHDEHGHEEEAGHEEMGHDEHGHEEEAGHEEMGHDEHNHGAFDPHFWFDPIRVKIAVNEMAARLSALDPDNASVYYVNAAEYGKELDNLHAWIQGHVEMVPPERRLLVTSHDSLGYLAEAYGFKVVGLVIPSLAPDVEPSAEHVSEVIEAVRENNVPVVFGETTVSDRLAQTIARETGAELVQLYSGSMDVEGSGADTYLGMVRTNVERIVEALK